MRIAGFAVIVVALLAPVAGTRVAGAQPRSFPNVPLQTQSGAAVRFYDDLIKGKVVLINFFFTSCTSICPRTTDNLKRVQTALGEHLGRDVVMISISVDPGTDTPAVLEKYALRYGARPGWYFVTGRLQDIDLVRRHLGVNRDGGDKTQHTGMLAYGNERTGQWAATPAMADPNTIVRSVLRLIGPSAATAPPRGR
jgi:protein SCO1/2